MYFLNEVAKNGSNFLDYETAISLKGEEAEMAIYGSKAVRRHIVPQHKDTMLTVHRHLPWRCAH